MKQRAGPAESKNSPATKIRFVLVNLLAFAMDLAILNLFFSQGFSLSLAHIISFLAASGTGFFLNSIWAYKDKTQPAINRLMNFIITTFLILFLRGGILASLIQLGDFHLKQPWSSA
ncbi:MAG: GtrA family protein [Chromatiales bacterium]|nr:GtrA family protein [Chromatiales bacterium]